MDTIHKSALLFSFNVDHVKFNYPGSYRLQFAIRSSFTEDLSEILCQTNLAPTWYSKPIIVTSTVQVLSANEEMHFDVTKCSFALPKGFCVNDKLHDVVLIINASSTKNGRTSDMELVGEQIFPIFPSHFVDKSKKSFGVNENIYTPITDPMTLTRSKYATNLKMNCGTIRFRASLQRIRKMPSNSRPPSAFEPVADEVATSPSPRVTPVPDEPVPEVNVEEPVKSPSPVPSVVVVATMEDTLDRPSSPVETVTAAGRISTYISQPATEDIHIIIHGAANLPELINGKTPLVYCSVKTKSEQDEEVPAELTTPVSEQPTYTPFWEQYGVITLQQRTAPEEVLLFKLIDEPSKSLLACYRLPVNHLKPFHQYHLEMVMPSATSPNGVRLLVTITRKVSLIPRDLSSPNYIGLEVLLQGVKETLANPVGPITAVARLVTGYYKYWEDGLPGQYSGWSMFGITPTTVMFPNPLPALFSAKRQLSKGIPQVTLPGKPEIQPVWNHAFLFADKRDNATLFTPHSALVLEFYRTRTGMTSLTWKLENAVGHCVLPLDHGVYRHLAAAAVKDQAVRIDSLAMLGTLLTTVENKPPSVGLIIRLATAERPDSLISIDNVDDLPLLAVPNQLMGNNELPPHNALETLFPNQPPYVFDDDDVIRASRRTKKFARPASDTSREGTSLFEHQIKEVNRYRMAVTSMGEDILQLRDQVRDLETTNTKLRRELNNYNYTTRLLTDSNELDDIDKSELSQRYATLKNKMTKQTADLKDYKDKVVKLQNELIKKNDAEKQYLEMSHAHQSQNELLLKLQTKVAKVADLEAACKKQEKVIENLERLLKTKKKKVPTATLR